MGARRLGFSIRFCQLNSHRRSNQKKTVPKILSYHVEFSFVLPYLSRSRQKQLADKTLRISGTRDRMALDQRAAEQLVVVLTLHHGSAR
jgi:hypothetical protein